MAHKAKVIGIVAIKGGVGKTTIATNLGALLATQFEKRVVIVDANFSTPHVGISLGIAQPKITIHDVLEKRASIFDALYQHEKGFYVIPGKLSPREVRPLLLKEEIEKLKAYFHYVIIDSSPSLNDEALATLLSSDDIIVVSSQDYPTISSTLHAVQLATKRKTPISGIVLNKSRKKKYELSTEEIEDLAGVPVIATLPDDEKVLEALSMWTPVVLHSPKRKITKGFWTVANHISEEERPFPSITSRWGTVAKDQLNALGQFLGGAKKEE